MRIYPDIRRSGPSWRGSEAVALAQAEGARPQLRHLANTPATLTLPQTWFDMVRSGGAVVGLSTLPGGAPDWLRPAMTIRTEVIGVKRVPAGTAVSYGHRYRTSSEATIGLIPLGYNEGVPRHASNRAQVQVAGQAVDDLRHGVHEPDHGRFRRPECVAGR